MNKNREIWENLYRDGMFLAYPSEVFVRLFHRHGAPNLPDHPHFIDHGAGSGNNSEFLVRKGCRVVATDISEEALRTLSLRFRFCNLPAPETRLIKPDQPLRAQLPGCDAVLAWDSLYYNTAQRTREDIGDLISSVRPGGMIFLNMPGQKHSFIVDAEHVDADTYRFNGERGLQRGAIICAPPSPDALVEWCNGVEVLDVGTFGSRVDNFVTDFVYLVGRKPPVG